MTKHELVYEAAQRDAAQEERARVKKGYAFQVDPLTSAKVVMTKTEKNSWIKQRCDDWGRKPEDGGWTENQLTGAKNLGTN